MITKLLGIVGLLVCSFPPFNAELIKSDSLTRSCPNDKLYDPNSSAGRIYRANLDLLLSVLTSNASRPNGFYNFTTNPANNTEIYGLFLCRGDVGTEDCQDCVKTAGNEVLQLCPNRKAATIWYDNCMLRYSNKPIFSKIDGTIGLVLVNTVRNDHPALFGQFLRNTFDQLITEAANVVAGKKFAVGESNATDWQRIFTLGQCTPDLSSSDCTTCLRSAVQSLPNYPRGGRALAASCNVRYEMYRFYDVSAPLLIQLPSSPLPPSTPANSKGNGTPISTGAIVVIVVVPIVVIFTVAMYIVMRKWKARSVMVETSAAGEMTEINITTSAEFGKYSFSDIRNWTNNFAEDHKLGGGGFGNVYKGTLPNGEEIAVKRLFRGSRQGTKEFANEITLLAKLQHRNLVRLLGYCLKDEEKMLVYEFVPKRSLDYFLFDPEKQQLLNWLTRYSIVGGIAKGLLYLHEESRLKIIHCDLKASNVLLDENMTPKIADFGLARIFHVDQSRGSTSKIAGTYGYMAPEYAMHGVISVKSDVYSFGVLVLEIITGNKSSDFSQSHNNDDLLSYAWRQWSDGTPLALLDPSIKDSCNGNELIRCIHIGLLCVQEDGEDRPTMASVVLMLNSYSVTLPTPKPPSFFRSN